tara:strand:+ start:78 stop:716 length:639 start_codon:yes stop_codon:yes gene_type:complete
MLPIVGAMQSLQGLLTNLSGGLSSITSSIGGLGGAFSSVFDTLGTIAAGPLGEIDDKLRDVAGKLGDGFDKAKEKVGDVVGEVSGSLGDAMDGVKNAFFSIFDKKKVEEAIVPVKTAMEISETGYADAIIRGKIQEEQIATAPQRAAAKQQAKDVEALMSYASRQSGTVNVSINAAGITDQTDKRKMARDLAAQVQSEMARYNAGQTLRPRL